MLITVTPNHGEVQDRVDAYEYALGCILFEHEDEFKLLVNYYLDNDMPLPTKWNWSK